jgi:hypothetical protein
MRCESSLKIGTAAILMVWFLITLVGCINENYEMWRKPDPSIHGQVGTLTKYRGDITRDEWRAYYLKNAEIFSDVKSDSYWKMVSKNEDDRLITFQGKPRVFVQWNPMVDKSGETGVLHLHASAEHSKDAVRFGEQIAKEIHKKFKPIP